MHGGCHMFWLKKDGKVLRMKTEVRSWSEARKLSSRKVQVPAIHEKDDTNRFFGMCETQSPFHSLRKEAL